jgi:hypothetical protein
MSRTILPAEYAQLELEKKYDWMPVYKRWRLRIVESWDECDCCGKRDFTGWVSRRESMGKPAYYRYQPESLMGRLMRQSWATATAAMFDDSTQLNDSLGASKTISFTRYK